MAMSLAKLAVWTPIKREGVAGGVEVGIKVSILGAQTWVFFFIFGHVIHVHIFLDLLHLVRNRAPNK